MCAAPGSKTGQILESLRAGVSRVSLASASGDTVILVNAL